MADLPFELRPSATVRPLLAGPFALAELSRLRHEIEVASRSCGLSDDDIDDWVTAVNELMINVIRHGGGRGTVRLLLRERLTCEVTDEGPGFDAARYIGRTERPPLADTGGMGLWMVGRLADFLLADSGPGGTTIRIAARTGGVTS